MADQQDVRRIGDMDPEKFLGVFVQRDGDIQVIIAGTDGRLSVEFCSLASGGGRSQHTRKALLELIKAMELDNKENPII